MLKGQSLKLKESTCNIPLSEVDSSCMSLCRTADGSGLIVVKLNHKAEYYSHVLFEPARAIFFGSFVRFFKQYNHLYSDIEIDLDNTSELLTNFELSTRNLHEKMKNFWTVGNYSWAKIFFRCNKYFKTSRSLSQYTWNIKKNELKIILRLRK